MTDAAGRRREGSFCERGDSGHHRQTVETPAPCTLKRVVPALTDTDTPTDHPVVVQLQAGTPVVVVEVSTTDGMAEIRSDCGRRYTVFAADLEDSIPLTLQGDQP